MVTATPEATRTIELSNVGPIEHLSIPLNPEGGVTVLKGQNGCGKSYAIAAAERTIGNDKIKLPIRDGAKKAEVEGCGVHVIIGGKTNSFGELEVESLAGKFDLGKLVDPGIQDPAAADAARIKALLKLLDLPVEESVWHETVDGEERFNELGIELTGDPVTDAGRVKRALETEARKLEADADRLQGQYQTRIADLEEFGADVIRDAGTLNVELETAIKAKATLDNQAEVAVKDQQRRDEAKAKLDALPESNLPSLVEKAAAIKENRAAVVKVVDDLEAQKEAIVKKIAEQDAIFAGLEKDYKAANAAVDAEQQRCHDRTAFEAIISGDAMAGPTADEIAAAQAKVDEARELVELGSRARQADKHAEQANQLKAAENEARKKALRLREAAKSTDTVLSDMVGRLGVSLIVHEGRLSMLTDRGTDPEPFAELSQGERSRVATELGALRVGRGGVLPVPQEFWEGLDPANKQVIADTARKYGVNVITAEAAAGSIRAEAFTG